MIQNRFRECKVLQCSHSHSFIFFDVNRNWHPPIVFSMFFSFLDEIRGLLVPLFLECCHGSDVGMAQGLATGTWAGTGGTNEKRWVLRSQSLHDSLR